MSELSQAMRILGNLPDNILIQYENGKWGFVGSVRADLAYICKDGSIPTDEQLVKAARYGPRLVGLTHRVWDTEEEARVAI